MNRYAPHIYVIPEDDCDRQLADGFVLHDQVRAPCIQVMPPAGGWSEVLRIFRTEYVPRLRQFPKGHVVMVIDYDGAYANRRIDFEREIPNDLKDRVFVIGAKQTPEELKAQLGGSFDEIGRTLADDCFNDANTVWSHDHLRHNDPDRNRLISVVKAFLFGE